MSFAFLSTKQDRRALRWLVFLSFVTHLPWIVQFKNFTSGDWWYISLQRYHDFAQFSPIWVTDAFGGTSAVPHFYFIRFLEGVLASIGSNFMLNEKLFFLLPMTFAASIGAFALCRRYFSAWPSFIGAVVFAFNTAYLFNHVGPLTIGVAYALAPWCVYFFKRLIDEPFSWRLLLFTGLTFSITAAYELRITLIIAAICLGLFAFNTLSGDGWAYCKKRIWPLVGLGSLILLLHAFWILPYVISSRSVTFSDLLSRGLFVSFSDIQNALTLHHPFWTNSRPATFVIQPIPLYAWLIPIAAFGGFILRGRRINKEMYYWGMLAVAGLFLVKQVNEPFTNAYPWLFGHVPGFGAFRESSKFYLIVALSYAILIPFTLGVLKDWASARFARPRSWRLDPRLVYIGASVVVLALFLINTKPLLTGEFRTLYMPRQMPADYQKLEAFINQQPERFRTLWMPVNSRWGIQTNAHPAIQATSVNQGGWLGQIGVLQQESYTTLRDKAVALLNHTSSDAALDRAGIKYVIVPLRDTANEDDFFRYYGDDRQYYINQLDALPYLKKLNLGMQDVVVYENQGYHPYIDTFTNLQSFKLAKDVDIGSFYDFISQQTNTPFNFVAEPKKAPTPQPDYPVSQVTDISEGLQLDNLNGGTVHRSLPASGNPVLYIKPDHRRLYYTIAHNVLRLYATPQGGLQVNQRTIDAPSQTDTLLATLLLASDTRYYLADNDTPLDLSVQDGRRDLGVVDSALSIYAVSGDSIVPDGSFEDGLWQRTVGNCNHYDDHPLLNMVHSRGEATDGNYSLRFEADRQTACTDSPPLPNQAGNYLLRFNFKVDGGRTAGYELRFDDPQHTVIRKDLGVVDSRWQTHQRIITAPAGATSVTLRLLGYPDYRQQMHAITNYDNVQLVPLSQLFTTGAAATPATYTQVPLPANTPLHLSYPRDTNHAGNIVPNGNFEKGLWQQKVADCNAYDTTPVLSMNLAQGRQGKGLELTAKRHTACTSNTNIPVQENTAYLFSLDYQSPNASSASYFVRFNDPNRTTIEAHIPIDDGQWHTFAKQIKAPLGATRATIVLYAEGASAGDNTITNHYDNVALFEIPDLDNQYYVVDHPNRQVSPPQKVTIKSTTATRKTITIEHAASPFYMSMTEAYHPLWQLQLDLPSHGLASILPWKTTAPSVPARDHFKLNDFQNGWYVDPRQLCARPNSACQRNKDGSYNLAVVINFTPQRWFYAGGIVSLVTLISCLSYLLFTRISATRRSKQAPSWRRT